MRQRIWFSALVLVAAMTVGVTTADHLVTMEVEPPATADKEAAEKETYTIWVGDARLREDRKNRSMIVDRTAGKLYVIKHADKTYQKLDLPIDFESLVPQEMVNQWRTVLNARKPSIEIEPATETATVLGHEAKKYVAVITDRQGSSTRLEMWATANPGFDVNAYKKLMREVHALQPNSAEWIEQLFAVVDGYPVRMLRTASMPDGELVWTEEMVSVEEKPAPQGTWTPAEGYSEVEFSLLSAPVR